MNTRLAATLTATLIAITGTASVAPPPTADASTASLKRQIRKLRHDNTVLRERNATACAVIDWSDRCNVTSAMRHQLATNTTLRGDNTRLALENIALRGEIPARVESVAQAGNITDLFNLVILPARRAWKCGGTIFYGQTFWSVDFNRQGYCD